MAAGGGGAAAPPPAAPYGFRKGVRTPLATLVGAVQSTTGTDGQAAKLEEFLAPLSSATAGDTRGRGE